MAVFMLTNSRLQHASRIGKPQQVGTLMIRIRQQFQMARFDQAIDDDPYVLTRRDTGAGQLGDSLRSSLRNQLQDGGRTAGKLI